MDEDIQTPNLSSLPDTEATALANNLYYQPRIWDWAYENGQPPVWPKPWKGKGKERRRKNDFSGRRPSVCARFAVMFRRRNSRGFEGSDVEEETTIEEDVEGGKGLALDKVTTLVLEVTETTAEDRVGDQKQNASPVKPVVKRLQERRQCPSLKLELPQVDLKVMSEIEEAFEDRL